MTLFHYAPTNLPQYGKVIHSLENRYKFKAINDIYKDYLKICLNFHIFATLYIYKNKGAAQGQLPTGGKQSTRHGCYLSLSLPRGPNTTIVRPDFLNLASADTGVTLDLDKDGHSDSYQNQDADY